MTKFLILRFSSIGDIVLTTPVVRCLKLQYPNAEIHYATKKSFNGILENNPYIDKIHLLDESLNQLIDELKVENFDFIIDLHNNLRTKIIKFRLGKQAFSFNKVNLQKFLLTQFKIDNLPKVHIVDRYLNTLEKFNVKNDGKGLDYFIPQKDEVDLKLIGINEPYIGFVLGAKFATKRMPFKKMLEVCRELKGKVIFLGGKEDAEIGALLQDKLGNTQFYNACGEFNLNQSASLVKQAKQIITHDTGLMHIAAAFQKNIISIWGNTVPKFGMFAYVDKDKRVEVAVKNLSCRPCSKIGYSKCPKGHFKCMNQISTKEIISLLK